MDATDTLTRPRPAPVSRPGRWIHHWDPEDEHFWRARGFLIPRGFAVSLSSTGSIGTVLLALLAGYLVMVGATWWWYLRRSALVAQPPAPAMRSI